MVVTIQLVSIVGRWEYQRWVGRYQNFLQMHSLNSQSSTLTFGTSGEQNNRRPERTRHAGISKLNTAILGYLKRLWTVYKGAEERQGRGTYCFDAGGGWMRELLRSLA